MIAPLRLKNVAERCGGVLHGADVDVEAISTDSRSIKQGDLYLALRGDRFDGHDYIDDALKKNCKAIITEQSCDSAVPNVQVKDSRQALGVIAAMNRENFKGILVGITGSAGKTTCKNFLHSIFSKLAATCVTQGNLNNEIGVPLTLLSLQQDHGYAVVEMGARKLGDIKYLAEFARPDIAVLLNAGNAHIDVFGSYENIVAGKGEIFDSLTESGCGIVNLDDPAAEQWLQSLGERKVMGFSLRPAAGDVWPEQINYEAESTEFVLCTPTTRQTLTLKVPGKAGLVNALAASAAALAAGVQLQDIAVGLAAFEPGSGRLQRIRLGQGTIVIDDSYNANPVSMLAALDVLALQPTKRIAVLGEMAELGGHAVSAHAEVAEYAKNCRLDGVILLGPHAKDMAKLYGAGAYAVADLNECWDTLTPMLRGDEVVLVKGSRVAGLDQLVSRLQEELA